MKTARSALTSIELLVIIAIIILLPSVLIATLDHVRDLAKIPICAKNLKHIGLATYEYAQIYDGNLPNVAEPSGGEESHFYCAYRSDQHTVNDKLLPYRLACLYEAGLIDPKLFYCPANTYPRLLFESYTNPYPPNDSNEWGTLPQRYNIVTSSNQWVRCGYEWFPVDREPNLYPISYGGRPRAPVGVSRKFDNVDPNLPYCMDYNWVKDMISHRYNEAIGLNLLYTDGRVDFCGDPNAFSDPVWNEDPGGINYPEKMSIYYYRTLLVSGQLPN